VVWFVVMGDAADIACDRVRTLTGKEIELDIEPDYKVRVYYTLRIGSSERLLWPGSTEYICSHPGPLSLPPISYIPYPTLPYHTVPFRTAQENAHIIANPRTPGLEDKGARRGKRRHPARPAAVDLRRQANVRLVPFRFPNTR
jgi:hypothetical protein